MSGMMALARDLILILKMIENRKLAIATSVFLQLFTCTNAYGEGENRPPMRILTEQIEANPKNADLYLKRAELHTKYLNLDSAVADASKAIKLKPSEHAYMVRGFANRGLGRIDRAEADYEKAAQLAPKSQNAQAELACMAAKLNHFEKARKAFDALFKLNPGRTVELSRRAEMFIVMGKPAEALADCQKALKTDPDKGGRVHEIMGRAHFLLGQYQKAAAAYSYSIAKNQYNIEALRARAEAYEKLGKPELARKDRKELNDGFSEAFSNAPFRSK
ncbi:MAG: hypothetical protein C0507_15750 [Cyanobacteria bacterium PR.3.49]|nr:hypothetical protein [Cyanobacteria bacterium PR.3.49]